MTPGPSPPANDGVLLPAADLAQLFLALEKKGFTLVGPRRVDGDLVLDVLTSPADLPRGWGSRSEAGSFRLQPASGEALLAVGPGQHSYKQFLYPPRLKLWEARRQGEGFEIRPPAEPPPAYAFMGVRACDVAAIGVQDRVFLAGPYHDPTYAARRRQAFIVAVNCTQSWDTCFCASLGTGPQVEGGFDLALTELLDEGGHDFLVVAGSEAGRQVLASLPGTPATPAVRERAARLGETAAAQQRRRIDSKGLKELLYASFESPQWEEVASRCLTCGNCTLVCPTCFCHTVEDTADLSGSLAERWRRWDVCFTVEHSYIHGGSIRTSTAGRYRQWLTHKLATWVDQFGSLGCTGCGRCLTWCPVGIDITAEVQALRNRAGKE